jgi:hypothetical protein
MNNLKFIETIVKGHLEITEIDSHKLNAPLSLIKLFLKLNYLKKNKI